VFYATLIWAMFDRGDEGTLPRLTQQNLNDADQVVDATEELIVEVLKRNNLAPAALVSCVLDSPSTTLILFNSE